MMPNLPDMRIAARVIALLFLLAGAGFVLIAVRTACIPPSGIASVTAPADRAPRTLEAIPASAWSVLMGTPPANDNATGDVRYVGWFFVLRPDANGDGEETRSAILADSANLQAIVNEGDLFADYEIIRIFQDRIIMRRDDEEIELAKSAPESVGRRRAPTARGDANGDASGGDAILESNRFGQRIAEHRWKISKDALVDYYQELLLDPERIAAIYATHKPDYNEDRDILGYRIEMEGEQEFFDMIGIREGDYIRKVNSMNMISQRRAEYFIGEFMQDRLGAVVMDVERDGEMLKLIYFLE